MKNRIKLSKKRDFIISTIFVIENELYETAVKGEKNFWIVLEEYYNGKDANQGHTKWESKIEEGFVPIEE